MAESTPESQQLQVGGTSATLEVLNRRLATSDPRDLPFILEARERLIVQLQAEGVQRQTEKDRNRRRFLEAHRVWLRQGHTQQVLVLLFIGIALEAIILAFLAFSTNSALRLILYFMAGGLAMATLSSLSSLRTGGLEAAPRPQQVKVTFNTAIVTQQIDQGWRNLPAPLPAPSGSESSGDPALRTLIGQDNSLALAYLRMQIERVLRQVLDMHGLNWAGSSIASARGMADILVKKDLIDAVWVTPLEEVIGAANQAVHGAVVADTTALAVVSSGEQILRYLRSLTRVAKPTT